MLCSCCCWPPARPAQLPTATGRQIAMSNAAWKIFIPSTYQYRPGNVADLLVHFHGDPQTFWNNAQYAKLNAIIVTVNYSGLSSAYSTPFSNASLFQTVVNEALTKVRLEADIPDTLQWDKLGVSSFSAGYGAVREILKSADVPQRHRCLARGRFAVCDDGRRRHATRFADGGLQDVRDRGQSWDENVSVQPLPGADVYL